METKNNNNFPLLFHYFSGFLLYLYLWGVIPMPGPHNLTTLEVFSVACRSSTFAGHSLTLFPTSDRPHASPDSLTVSKEASEKHLPSVRRKAESNRYVELIAEGELALLTHKLRM